MIEEFGALAMEALDPHPGERILDIGCGAGATTVELAVRVGPSGEAVGVDVSPDAIATARRRPVPGDQVRFVALDAGIDPLGERYDAAYSRFGVMFFGDAVAAFANIAAALRPGGRLAWAVLGDPAANPWLVAVRDAAAPTLGVPGGLPGGGRPGPFSLCDPEATRAAVDAAGFVDVAVTPVEGVLHLSGGDAAVASMLAAGPLGAAYGSAGETARATAVAAVVTVLAPYRAGEGWDVPGAAFVVTGHRPG